MLAKSQLSFLTKHEHYYCNFHKFKYCAFTELLATSMLGKVQEHIMITRIPACSRRCKLHSVATQEDNGPNFLNDILTSICNFWVDELKTIEEGEKGQYE
jgi:hypothetical protein